jgi:hypothetical protein
MIPEWSGFALRFNIGIEDCHNLVLNFELGLRFYIRGIFFLDVYTCNFVCQIPPLGYASVGMTLVGQAAACEFNYMAIMI